MSCGGSLRGQVVLGTVDFTWPTASGGLPDMGSVLALIVSVGAACVAVKICQQDASYLIVAMFFWTSQVGNSSLIWDFFLEA